MDEEGPAACQGPCYLWCSTSRGVAALAYAAAGYVIASLVYLALSIPLGTPFADSLTAHQRGIKRVESMKRGAIFLGGIVVATVALALWRPIKVARDER